MQQARFTEEQMAFIQRRGLCCAGRARGFRFLGRRLATSRTPARRTLAVVGLLQIEALETPDNAAPPADTAAWLPGDGARSASFDCFFPESPGCIDPRFRA